MIISKPDDQRGLLYHIINLFGHTVHAYRDYDAAINSREGDQRIYIQDEQTGEWIGGKPCPHPEVFPEFRPNVEPTVEVVEQMANQALALHNELLRMCSKLRETNDLTYAAEASSLVRGFIGNVRFDLLIIRPLREYENRRK